jgi:hypothetical protein
LTPLENQLFKDDVVIFDPTFPPHYQIIDKMQNYLAARDRSEWTEVLDRLGILDVITLWLLDDKTAVKRLNKFITNEYSGES